MLPWAETRRGLSHAFHVALVGTAFVGAGCAGQDSSGTADRGERDRAAGHVHAFASSPRDGRTYIATHTGLFELRGRGGRRPVRVGSSRHDFEELAVANARRLISSGHPDPRMAAMPTHLGLLESRNRGRSWTPVSLYGRADLHVLEAAGPRIYGFDQAAGRVMVSRDGGRRWRDSVPPDRVVSLAVDPKDPERLAISTDSEVYSSSDGAATWQRVTGELAGLLAWPARAELYLVDRDGRVRRSKDGGQIWSITGTIGGPPTAIEASTRSLLVALSDGLVKRSTNGGVSWDVLAEPGWFSNE
jgi:hypothetical protein